MKLMPFNFERLPGGDYFLSNLAGFHCFLDPQSFHDLTSQQSIKLGNSILENRFFVTRDDQEEATLVALGSGFSKRLIRELVFRPVFMIVPTLRCDHECSYCQVSRASQRAKNYDLDEANIPKIIAAIKKLGKTPFQIEIQGGEPLLRTDLIEKIYQEASDVLGEKNFEIVIATSLSLLNEAVITWAQPRRVHFSTSLDGTSIIHNTNRILPGNSSFDRVKKAVASIREELGEGRVATVTTVTEALINNPREIIEAHIELGLLDMFVRPISPYGFANNQVAYDMQTYLAFYEELFDLALSYNKKGVPIIEHSAGIHIKRLLNPGFNGYADLKSPSGYMLNCILFNYDGRVFGSDETRMLQRIHPDVDFSCGQLDDCVIQENELVEYIMSSSFNFDSPGCSDCAYQPFCGSDPCQNISIFGEPVGDKSLSPFCEYHKGMFSFLLNRLHTDPQSAYMLKRWSCV